MKPFPALAPLLLGEIHTLIAFTRCRGGLHAHPQEMTQPLEYIKN